MRPTHAHATRARTREGRIPISENPGFLDVNQVDNGRPGDRLPLVGCLTSTNTKTGGIQVYSRETIGNACVLFLTVDGRKVEISRSANPANPAGPSHEVDLAPAPAAPEGRDSVEVESIGIGTIVGAVVSWHWAHRTPDYFGPGGRVARRGLAPMMISALEAPARPASYVETLRADRSSYVFAPYDVLQVTYDDGARWDDYGTLRCDADANFAWQRVWGTRGQSDRFRITRNQRVILS